MEYMISEYSSILYNLMKNAWIWNASIKRCVKIYNGKVEYLCKYNMLIVNIIIFQAMQ